jgi:hypothetical protein
LGEIDPGRAIYGDYIPPTPVDIAEKKITFSRSTDPVNPNHYRFPGGIELNSITKHLTGNGAQAVQYVARATRLDGSNKGDLVEDLKKAQWFIESELQRLAGAGVEVSREPRKWGSLADVRFDVEVVDAEGDRWAHIGDEWMFRSESGWKSPHLNFYNDMSEFGPYKEVIK